MSRSHASKRTVAQWVTWSKSEGYEGILETGPNEQVQGGKVYCNLCAIFFVADAKTIKQHCNGNCVTTPEGKVFKESAHAKEVARLKELEEKQQAALASSPSKPQEFVFKVWYNFLKDF